MIVELRQYTLHEGRRDELIDVFDREFVETQEELGMAVLGQFRDLDRPDRFVWLRGFIDMPSRETGLTAFYTGPVWKEHGPAANATMLDSDDVLLLRETPNRCCTRRSGTGTGRSPTRPKRETRWRCCGPSTRRTTFRGCRYARENTHSSGSPGHRWRWTYRSEW
jgi:hypothetical protein